MTDKYNLRPLWRAILDVYEQVYAICERHQLRIFVAYGTEIGAMRHQGFIPWDDDFDVYMPRPDYNRFMELASKELPDYLEWHSIENDPDYHLLFGKVIDTRKDVIDRVKRESNLALNQGVFIDFFPLDGLPATKAGIFLWNVQRSLIRRAFDARNREHGLITLFYKFIALFLPRFKDERSYGLYLQNWISRLPFDSSRNVGWNLDTLRFPKYIKRREWFDSAKIVPFENTQVPVPIGVLEDLKAMYGDYKKLPPKEQRKPSHQNRRVTEGI